MIAGDFLHVGPVQFPPPEYSLIFDAEVNGAVAKRKLVLERRSKEKILVAGMHIQFTGIGNVKTGSIGFVFKSIR